MADIQETEKPNVVEFEPMPEEAPVSEPSPSPTPEPVPA